MTSSRVTSEPSPTEAARPASPTPRFLADASGGRWIAGDGTATEETPLAGVGIDTRERLDGRAFLAIRGARRDGHEYLDAAVAAGAACLVVESPWIDRGGSVPSGVPVIAVADARRALVEMARAWRRQLGGRVVGVTGTCGKTTTKRLMHAALASTQRGSASPKSFNNDLGVPLTLLAARADDDYVVVEIGTNRPGEIAFLSEIARPHVAVITLVGHGHLEELGSLEGVAAEKASMLDRLVPPAIAVVRGDQAVLASAVAARRARLGEVITFGLDPSTQVRLAARRALESGQEIELGDGRRFRTSLEGEHNALNAVAALAVAERLGVPFAKAAVGLAAVTASEHRGERRMVAGFHLVDDAYNANPDSMAAALANAAERFEGQPVALVLGDMLELGASGPELHRRLGRRAAAIAARLDLRVMVFVGPLSRHAFEAFRSSAPGFGGVLEHVESPTPDLADRIATTLPTGGTILLKASRGVGLDRLGRWLESREATATIETMPTPVAAPTA
jgi:UDP-N-acetylmuramoyl-tripeptide--D-alanyl-D-alanine ligase